MNKLRFRLFALVLSTLPLGLWSQSSQGPLNPGTLTNNTASCPFAYSSSLNLSPAGNAASSNNSYASASHCDCCDANTSCLMATNFGFSIPAGATITGIQVEIEKRRSVAAGGIIEDNGLRLIKAGSVVGTDHASFGVNWPTTDAYSSYGGSSDLWGTTWTAAEINASNFGVAFACISYTCGATMTSFVDHIRITIFYNSGLPIELSKFSGEIENEKVILHWINETLNPAQRLWAERSADGLVWQEAGIAVAGAGMLVDQPPASGRWAYRLKTFANGVDFTSEVIWLNTQAEYPFFKQWIDRQSQQWVLDFRAPVGHFRIFDPMGRLFREGAWSQTGERLHFALSDLPANWMLVEVESNGKTQRRLVPLLLLK